MKEEKNEGEETGSVVVQRRLVRSFVNIMILVDKFTVFNLIPYIRRSLESIMKFV